jgi:hypothetical protein
MNYLCWINDLLKVLPSISYHQDINNDNQYNNNRLNCNNSMNVVVGLDIGVGASCVYPLLGSMHFAKYFPNNVFFIGSDVDAHSLSIAIENVNKNVDILPNKPLNLCYCSKDISKDVTNTKSSSQSCIDLYLVPNSLKLQQFLYSTLGDCSYFLMDSFMIALQENINIQSPEYYGPLRRLYQQLHNHNNSTEDFLSRLHAYEKHFLNNCSNSNIIMTSNTTYMLKILPDITFSMCNPPFYSLDEQV